MRVLKLILENYDILNSYPFQIRKSNLKGSKIAIESAIWERDSTLKKMLFNLFNAAGRAVTKLFLLSRNLHQMKFSEHRCLCSSHQIFDTRQHVFQRN